MNIGKIDKQPAETLDYDVDYAAWMADDDVIATAVVTLAEAGTVAIEVVPLETRVKLWVSGGVDGQEGVIEVTATTTGGRIKQDEINLRIVEVN